MTQSRFILAVLLLAGGHILSDAPAEGAADSQIIGALNTQRVASIYSSCGNSLNQPIYDAIGVAIEANRKWGDAKYPLVCPSVVGIETDCPSMTINAEESKSYKCSDFSTTNGIGGFKVRDIDAEKKEIKSNECAMSCRESKAKALTAEMKCLTDGAAVLNQQFSSMKNYFDNNIYSILQGPIKQWNTLLADVKSKQDFINDKLQRLSALQQKFDGVADKVVADVNKVKQDQMQVVNTKAAFENEVNQIKLGKTMECFRNAGESNAVPHANGPLSCYDPTTNTTTNAVSSFDYIVCMGAQLAYKNPTGGAAMSQASYQAIKSQIAAVLNRMVTETPSQTDVTPLAPLNSNGGQAPQQGFTGQTFNVNSLQDLEKYANVFATMGSWGAQLQNFTKQELERCYATNSAVIDAARKSATAGSPSDFTGLSGNPANSGAGSSINVKQANINLQENQVRAEAETVINDYAKVYNQVSDALLGQPNALVLQNCRGNTVALQVQYNCMDQLKSNVVALLTGEGQVSVDGATSNATMVPLQIRGTNPQTYETLNCPGLQGCVTALDTLAHEKINESQFYSDQKRQFVENTANVRIKSFLKNMIQTLQPQAQQLQSQLNRIQAGAASLGESVRIKGRQMQGQDIEKLDKDQDGLLVVPTDWENLIGGNTKPPIQDIDEVSGEIGGAVGKVTKDMNKERARMSKLLTKLESLKKECTTQKNQLAPKKFLSELKDFKGDSCFSYLSTACADGSAQKDRVNGLMKDYQNIVANLDTESFDDDTITDLSKGVKYRCANPPDPRKQKPDVDPTKNDPSTLGDKYRECATRIDGLEKSYDRFRSQVNGTGANSAEDP